MTALHIRPARTDEAQAVLDFWRTAAEGTSVSDDLDGVCGLLARDPGALLLAESDGRLVGTVIAGFDGWRCSLYRLAVLPAHRRRGVATALLTAAERRFAALGGRRVDAMVLEENHTGRQAWSASGYQRQDHWRRWVKGLALPVAGEGEATPPPLDAAAVGAHPCGADGGTADQPGR